MTKIIKKFSLLGVVFLTIFSLSALPVLGKDEDEVPKEISSLNELLLKVQEEALYDSEENRARIAKFMAEKSTQDAVLQETLGNLKIQEDRAVRLEKTFDENDVKLSELEDLKAERLGAFGELWGAQARLDMGLREPSHSSRQVRTTAQVQI